MYFPMEPRDEQIDPNRDGLATVGKWVTICFFFFGLWAVFRDW